MTSPSPWPESPLDQPDAASTPDMALLSSLLEASGDCIKVFDLQGNLLFMNQAGRQLMEVSDFEALRLCPWDQFWPEGANPSARAALAAARAGGSARFSIARNSFAGNPRVWDVRISTIPGPDGQPDRLLVISRNITEHQPGTDARQLQSVELNHRIKNQMAVVQSIVNQTLRGAYPLDIAKAIIAARLDVLARTHDLLMHSAGERAAVRAIVETGTQLLDSRRVTLGGPEMTIGPKAALSLALALHELSNNALAHGALSVPGGHIAIRWGLGEMDGEPAFEFSFAESGGPLVSPPKSRGFGSRLLQGGLSGSTSQATLDFHPQGLQFRLVAILASVQSEA